MREESHKKSFLAHPCLSFWSSFSRVQEACGFSCSLSFCLHIGTGCFSPPPTPGDTPVSPPGSPPPFNGTLPLRCGEPAILSKLGSSPGDPFLKGSQTWSPQSPPSLPCPSHPAAPCRSGLNLAAPFPRSLRGCFQALTSLMFSVLSL